MVALWTPSVALVSCILLLLPLEIDSATFQDATIFASPPFDPNSTFINCNIHARLTISNSSRLEAPGVRLSIIGCTFTAQGSIRILANFTQASIVNISGNIFASGSPGVSLGGLQQPRLTFDALSQFHFSNNTGGFIEVTNLDVRGVDPHLSEIRIVNNTFAASSGPLPLGSRSHIQLQGLNFTMAVLDISKNNISWTTPMLALIHLNGVAFSTGSKRFINSNNIQLDTGSMPCNVSLFNHTRVIYVSAETIVEGSSEVKQNSVTGKSARCPISAIEFSNFAHRHPAGFDIQTSAITLEGAWGHRAIALVQGDFWKDSGFYGIRDNGIILNIDSENTTQNTAAVGSESFAAVAVVLHRVVVNRTSDLNVLFRLRRNSIRVNTTSGTAAGILVDSCVVTNGMKLDINSNPDVDTFALYARSTWRSADVVRCALHQQYRGFRQ